MEHYSKGVKVWVPDREEVWSQAAVTKWEENGDIPKLFLTLLDGTVMSLAIIDADDLPPLVNPDILLGEANLTRLSYLHEPAVLHNLKMRFIDLQQMYTYCGIVLVAINPYQPLPIYEKEMIVAYHRMGLGDADPHIYAIAEEALRTMSREAANQSVVVSGESGAGKTVSAKHILRYLATVSGSDSEAPMEKRVLATNPVMESMGNAKTIRNDNSSRFGKYLQIQFEPGGSIAGATMATYLLEKSRVVCHAKNERNYHIFYQLCSAAEKGEGKAKGLSGLELASASQFHYLRQGGSVTVAGMDDEADFHSTCAALDMLGVGPRYQVEVFTVLAAILHLGNIEVHSNKQDKGFTKSSDHHLMVAAWLLGVSQSDLQKWLCNKLIVTSAESIVTPLNPTQVLSGRDGLAKHLYSQLFGWIVCCINSKMSAPSDSSSFIGVLDIYGFEVFAVNSFEQFCINYANEKLQQQFNWHVFKLEQEEYIREQIDWSVISFHDNQPCIDLIEGKYGILDLLDETCKLPGGSDQVFTQKLYQTHLKKTGEPGRDVFLGKPRTSTSQFTVYHFADKVVYDVWGFLEKNMDRVAPEHLAMLKSSGRSFVADLFQKVTGGEGEEKKQKKGLLGRRGGGVGAGQGRTLAGPSVGAQFKGSLRQLMSTLNSTTPHYIRCIKPNDGKLPFHFEPHRAVQQLRACGVLETVKISAAGYPSRWAYSDFFHRYRLLLPWGQVRLGEEKAMSEKIVRSYIEDETKYCFGKTKIFFRAGQLAYLENLRSDKLHRSSVMIQKNVKAWLQRRRYLRFRQAAIFVQKRARGCLVRRMVEGMRRTNAAIIIQKWCRCHQAQQRYQQLRRGVLFIQRRLRGHLGRVHYRKAVMDHKATVIQSRIRGWLARVAYCRALQRIVKVQSCVRRWLAIRELKRLKTEARSLDHVQRLNKGLENKIIELQQKLVKQEDLQSLLESTKLEAAAWRRRADESDASLRETVSELQQNNLVVCELTEQVTALRIDLSSVRSAWNAEREQFLSQMAHLKEKVDNMEQQSKEGEVQKREEGAGLRMDGESPLDPVQEEDGYYSSRHSEAESGDLQQELVELRGKHQKLIIEYISMQNSLRHKKGSGDGYHGNAPPTPTLTDALQSEVARLMEENLALREMMEKGVSPGRSPQGRSIIGSNSPLSNTGPRPATECKYLGMFSFRPEDLPTILQRVVLTVQPSDMVGRLPCLPAHILFMCARFVDHWNNTSLMEQFMNGVIKSIQQVTSKRSKDLDYLSFWLANTHRLCLLLRQFSSQTVTGDYTPLTMDLSDFRHVLEQKSVALCLEVAGNIHLRMEPLIVPGLLEHNPLPGMPTVPASPQGSFGRLFGGRQRLVTADMVVEELSVILEVLHKNCVDPQIISQLMTQVFRMANAHMLNSLLLRKDLCHWSKGIQISYNVSHLEDWCHDNHLRGAVEDQLRPIKEAAKLLQLRKATEKDAMAVVDLCTHLSSLQIQKILTMYTPGDFEGKVPSSLIRLIGERCRQRDGSVGQQLLVHTDDSLLTPYATANGVHSTETVNNLRSLSTPNSMMLDQLLIKI